MGRESHPSYGVGPSAEALLRETAARRVTGALEITHRGGEASLVWLRDGDIYSLSVAGYRPALGIRLLSGGIITPEQLSTAASEQRNRLAGRRIGEVLVELGFVTADLIESVLLEQVHDQLADLLDLPVVSSSLHVGRRISQDTFTPHRMDELLGLASDRRRRRVGLLRDVGGPDVVPHLGPQGRGSTQTPLGPRDWALLCRVDGRRSLAELGRICGFTVFETAELMSALATAGLVLLPEPPVEEEPPLAPVLQLPLEAGPSADWAFSDGGIGEPEPLMGAPELNQRVAEDDLSIALAPVAEKWEPPGAGVGTPASADSAGAAAEAATSPTLEQVRPEKSPSSAGQRLAALRGDLIDPADVMLGGWDRGGQRPIEPVKPALGPGAAAGRSALSAAAGALAELLEADHAAPTRAPADPARARGDAEGADGLSRPALDLDAALAPASGGPGGGSLAAAADFLADLLSADPPGPGPARTDTGSCPPTSDATVPARASGHARAPSAEASSQLAQVNLISTGPPPARNARHARIAGTPTQTSAVPTSPTSSHTESSVDLTSPTAVKTSHGRQEVMVTPTLSLAPASARPTSDAPTGPGVPADQVVVVASPVLSISTEPTPAVPEPRRRTAAEEPPVVVTGPPAQPAPPAHVRGPRAAAPQAGSGRPTVAPTPTPAVALAEADTTSFMRELAGLSDASQPPAPAAGTRQVVPLAPPPPKKRHFWSR